jgi:hypothetical protein
MADPGLGIKDFSLLAVAPSGEQRVDLVVNPLPKAFFARPAEQLAPKTTTPATATAAAPLATKPYLVSLGGFMSM